MSADAGIQATTLEPMALVRAFNRMKQAGFSVGIDSADLVISPFSKLTDTQRAYLRAHKAATDEYREEMDVFGPFIRECCVIHRTAEVRANELFNAYKAWCTENGVREQTQHKFGRYLSGKGWKTEGDKPVKRVGIGLLERHHDDLYDNYDITSGNPPIETPYGDFPEKGRKGRKGRNESPDTGISSHQQTDSPSVDSADKGRI